MKRTCAYCISASKLTREHIIPKFLYELNEKNYVGFNSKANKVIQSEHQIKDVCSICNNERLSLLDSYGKRLYLTNNLEKNYPSNVKIKFKYDYHYLLRFLLKMTYNQSRFSGKFDYLYSDLRNYILHGSDLDKISNLKLFLEICSRYKLNRKDKIYIRNINMDTIFEEGSMREFISHEKFSVGHGLLLNGNNNLITNQLNPSSPNILISYVILNSYFFYILHFHRGLKTKEIDKMLRNELQVVPYSKRLTERNKQATVQVSKRDPFHHSLVKSSYENQRTAWDNYFSSNVFLD